MARNRQAVVIRSSSVIAGVDGKLHFFSDAKTMPDALRREMEQAFQGGLTATVILADEGGQAYLRDNPNPSRSATAESAPRRETPRRVAGTFWTFDLVRALILECVAAGSLAVLLYLFAAGR